MKDYRAIFERVEAALIRAGSANLPIDAIRARLDAFKQVEGKTFFDADYYRILVGVIFYSGFRAATVTAKIGRILEHFPDPHTVAGYDELRVDEILRDPGVIRNRRKVEFCVSNAKIFQQIITRLGSFQAYIDSFEPKKSLDHLLSLQEELERTFAGLGPVTVYHFLTDIGMPVLKPDRVICRIFTRLGLIADESRLWEAVLEGRNFAQATGHPIRYIDIVFVAYGQMESREYGLTSGICLERKPLCSFCGVSQECTYPARG